MSFTLSRPRLENLIGSRLEKYPVVEVLGARNIGKTYMAKRFASSPAHHFDLENSYQAQALEDNALTILGSLEGTVVIDEVQELPSIFPALRVLADREPTVARFVISGSVSPRIIQGISESLAGRVATLEIGGFDLEETGAENWNGCGCAVVTHLRFWMIPMRGSWSGGRITWSAFSGGICGFGLTSACIPRRRGN